MSIVDLASRTPTLSTLVQLVTLAGLQDALAQPSKTVFAPTNDAFAALDPKLVRTLKANISLLRQVLLYHVLGVVVYSADIDGCSTPATLNGKNLCIVPYTDAILVNDAQVVKADIEATNGVVHVIDKVLNPLVDFVCPNCW